MSKHTAPEAQLVTAARAGDSAALEALITRHMPNVQRFSMKLCQHAEDAADVSQETLMAASGAISQFRGEASFGSWLYAIARSFCIKKRRRGKFDPSQTEPIENLHNLAADVPSPEEDAIQREMAAAINTAVLKLEPIYRDVFILRDIEGYTAEETGRELGLNVHTVKTRLHRARAAVRESLS